MKSLIITLTIFFTAGMLLAGSQPIPKADIKDGLCLVEEAYVDDIPFDTWTVSLEASAETLMMMLPEEEYVDDIPFNTARIAQNALLKKVMKDEEEASVDDIPFDTEKICNEALMKECVARWQDEKNVDDIPFELMEYWSYNPRKDMLIYRAGSTIYLRGIKSLNNSDFMLDTERYLEEFNERLREMENLSFEYPF